MVFFFNSTEHIYLKRGDLDTWHFLFNSKYHWTHIFEKRRFGHMTVFLIPNTTEHIYLKRGDLDTWHFLFKYQIPIITYLWKYGIWTQSSFFFNQNTTKMFLTQRCKLDIVKLNSCSTYHWTHIFEKRGFKQNITNNLLEYTLVAFHFELRLIIHLWKKGTFTIFLC